MSMRQKRLVVGLALFAVIVVPAALGLRFYRSLPSEPLAVGSPAPAFDVEPLGTAQSLPGEGRRVLFFFSPSCPHCENVMSQFDRFREEHPEWFSADRGLKWVMISTAGRTESVAFANSVPWPVFYDAERRALRLLRGVSVPYLVLVNEQGLVAYRHQGERGLSQHEELIGMFYRTGSAAAQ